MARSHSTDGKAWTNPEVRFERSDVQSKGVLAFGVALTVALFVIVPAMFWLGATLLRWESPRKVTDLPPAAVDADRLPPEPRLEYIEKGQPRVTPPRAADLLAGQRRLLEDGDPKKGIEPIETTIDALAGKLPARGGEVMRKLWVALALVALGGVSLLATTLPPRPKTRAVEDADLKKLFKPRMGVDLPRDAAFRDETGKKVTLGDYGHDRPFVLVPVYLRCPSLCNEVLNELVKGLRGIAALDVGRDFDVVVVSFDAREQPEMASAKKTAYAEDYARRGSEKGWHFLTGEQPGIDRLLEAIGYRVVWDDKKQMFLHASGVVVCTPAGVVVRYFPGLDYRPLYLRLALAEAGQGTITPGIIDQVLLPCFVFDSSKGQYSAAVLTIVKGSGVATVVAVLLFWAGMALRRRTGSLACPSSPEDRLAACPTTGSEATR